jgi:hypothetical protein
MNWKGCGRRRNCTDVCWNGLRKDMKTLSEMSVSAAGFELETYRTRYRTAIFGPSLWRTKQVNMVTGIHFWFTPWLLLPPGLAPRDCKSDRVTLPSALLSATDGVYTPNMLHNRKRITEFHITEVLTNTTRLAPAFIPGKMLQTFPGTLETLVTLGDMTSLLTTKRYTHKDVRERSAGTGGATGLRFLPAAHLSLSYGVEVSCWGHSTSYVMGAGEGRRRS